jgi:hypothetical protein
VLLAKDHRKEREIEEAREREGQRGAEAAAGAE